MFEKAGDYIPRRLKILSLNLFMSSIFDPKEQEKNIDAKIVAGLERISRVFKLLLWDVAKEENLSPIQIQFLIYLAYNRASRSRITDIANEFGLTKATVSDAISSLEDKGLVTRVENKEDRRNYFLKLTQKGKKVAEGVSNWADVLKNELKNFSVKEKETLLSFILNLIGALYDAGIITVQRMCFSCVYFQKNAHPDLKSPHHCGLLDKPLSSVEIRLDCEDYEPTVKSA